MLYEVITQDGCVYAVDCDLKSFFDKVDHRELMRRLRRRIEDNRVLCLIGVITSYSIHYTKLYDRWRKTAIRLQKKDEGGRK